MNIEDALCAQIGSEMFFPESNVPLGKTAKKICMKCPITVDCLKFALESPTIEDHGIWGATTVRERAVLRRDPVALQRFIQKIENEKSQQEPYYLEDIA